MGGYDRHHQRAEAVAALGRALSRRAGSRCELCGAPDGLRPVEVPPLPERPDPERAVLLCARCRRGVEGGRLDPGEWRFLETAAWSEVPAVQVVAVRLLRRLAEGGVDWARDALELLYLSPEVEAWVEGQSPAD